MGTWSGSVSAGYTLSGGGTRSAYMFDRPYPSASRVRLFLRQPADEVRCLILSSADGRTGLEIGVRAANVDIREVTFGSVGGTPVSTDANDTPASATATVAHGLTAGQAYQMDVELYQDRVKVYFNNSSTPVLSWGIPSSKDYLAFDNFGFVSSIDTAFVTKAELCDLVVISQDRLEMLVIACGGDVYYTTDGENYALMAASVFEPGVQVSMVAYNQKVYGVDGSNAMVIDPVNLTVTAWAPTAGNLPGATEFPVSSNTYLDGTTRAKVAEVYRGRIVLAVDGDLHFSAVDDPLDWNTAAVNSPGKAYVIQVALGGRVGSPITALRRTSLGSLIIGTERGMWECVGDFATGLPDLNPKELGSGVSGPEAISEIVDGRIIAHSPDGMYRVDAGMQPINFSDDTLTTGLEIASDTISDYFVQVVRETSEKITHVFLTPETSGAATHFRYREQIGGFQRGAGGFFPQTLPNSVGPTASIYWQGKLLLGTRDGLVLYFDDATTNDDTTAIDSMFAILVDAGGIRHDTIVSNLQVNLGLDSDGLEYEIYGGRTAEEAYKGASRTLLRNGTFTSTFWRDPFPARDPAIVIEFGNDNASESYAVESLDAAIEMGSMTMPRTRTTEATQTPCEYPTASSGDGGFDPGGTESGAFVVVYPLHESFDWDEFYGPGAMVSGAGATGGGGGGGGGQPKPPPGSGGQDPDHD